jgi:uncharacterized protein YgiM (DUF1202 family)
MVLCIQERLHMIYTNRILISALLFVTVTLIGACGGSGSATIADVVEQVAQQGNTDASSGSSSAGSTTAAIDSAKATVSARSLRVRAEPSPDAEVLGGIKEGQVYDVIGLSSDGEWVQLAIPALQGGKGWVSSNFVSVEGAITGATITEAAPVAAVRLPTPTPRRAPQIAAAPGTATVQTEGLRLRVRAQPSAEAEIVGYVYNGEVYTVTGKTDDGLWTQIGGRTGTDNINGGWVATEFLVLN